jgi:hypothetical protein
MVPGSSYKTICLNKFLWQCKHFLQFMQNMIWKVQSYPMIQNSTSKYRETLPNTSNGHWKKKCFNFQLSVWGMSIWIANILKKFLIVRWKARILNRIVRPCKKPSCLLPPTADDFYTRCSAYLFDSFTVYPRPILVLTSSCHWDSNAAIFLLRSTHGCRIYYRSGRVLYI